MMEEDGCTSFECELAAFSLAIAIVRVSELNPSILGKSVDISTLAYSVNSLNVSNNPNLIVDPSLLRHGITFFNKFVRSLHWNVSRERSKLNMLPGFGDLRENFALIIEFPNFVSSSQHTNDISLERAVTDRKRSLMSSRNLELGFNALTDLTCAAMHDTNFFYSLMRSRAFQPHFRLL